MKSPKSPNEEKPKEKKHKVTSTSADFTESISPMDSVRLKCREMLAKALKPNSEDDCKSKVHLYYRMCFVAYCILFLLDCMSVEDLEEAIFKEFKGTDTKYKNRVRSIISNLNDPKNALRTKCRIGALTAQRQVLPHISY